MSNRISRDQEIDNVFQISHRAEKSLDLQVDNVAKANLHIGESKQAEYQRIKDGNGGKISAHARGQGTGFHSWDTFRKYKSDFKSFAHYCRSEFGVKKIAEIRPEMAGSFLRELSGLAYSRNSVNGFVSAISKFGSFLKIDFQQEINAFKHSDAFKSLEAKDVHTRAYADPEKIIAAIKEIGALATTSEKVSFSAHLSLTYGLRINDACHFKLDGNRVHFNSKNGMKTVKELSPQDAAKAEALVDSRGTYNISINTANDVWRKACAKAGVENQSWHGLRHNFAQNTYTDLRESGLSHKEACSVCSHEMNHSREQITEVYLR